MPQIGAINFDENLYPNAEIFQPTRFLNSEGTLLNFEYFMPFGIGKRSCLGEALARTELFIILTTLLQNFEFSAAYGKRELLFFKISEELSGKSKIDVDSRQIIFSIFYVIYFKFVQAYQFALFRNSIS